jgi:CubicO group peptidase (beta-lactamase class C family)
MGRRVPVRGDIACSFLCALLAGGCTFLQRDARIATAYISHTLCTAAFVSGLDPDRVYEEEIRPIPDLALYDLFLWHDIDRGNHVVEATLAGAFRSAAEYRGDLGCITVAPRARGAPPSPPFADREPGLLETHGDILAQEPAEPVEPADPRLRGALDEALAQPATRAIVVARSGRIIAERYARGYGPNTLLLGYSASKSVTSAIVGTLVRRQALQVTERAPVPEWSRPGDPRGRITIDDLLRMRTGLQWEEGALGGGADSATEMLYLAPDMAHFAADLPLAAAPGTQWQYNSGNAMILSRIVRDQAGAKSMADVMRFVRRELFDPLGMRSATFEFDAAGTPAGSAGMLASARDWARFGLLYASDGVVAGRRILPEGWVEYSASPTPGAPLGYGAGFWTNRGFVPGGPSLPGDAAERIRAGMPAEAFFAHGFLGQMIVVVPSRGLVVVRFGSSHGPDEELEGVSRLVGEVLRATGEGS